MSSKNSPRQKAFDILFRIHTANAYSNLTIDTYLQKDNMENRDKAFVSALVYGVCERQLTLDYNLSLYLKQPLKKLKPEVLIALRLGAYQLLFMDKIPSSAAVNESVNLTKTNRASFASGLVNAVLRKVMQNGLCLPDEDDEYYLSVKYSCPQWLVSMWIKSYGKENAEKILLSSLGEVPVYIRVNNTKTNTDELISLLKEENVTAEKCDFPGALVLNKQGSVENLKAFKNGLFHVQDLSSQLCATVLGAESGEKVLDVCSAPGGKTFTVSENIMGDCGSVTACDIYPARVKLIEEGAERLGLKSVKTSVSDATVYNESFGLFDKVLCDVPCSGLGIIRRKPEIKYKSADDIDKLHNLQYLILCITSRYVKKSGRLLYSTCSLNPKENTEICRKFLAENRDFVLCDIPLSEDFGIVQDKMLTVMPFKKNTDGFFMALFERKGE